MHLEALMIVNVISISFLYHLQETDIYAGLKYNRENKGSRENKQSCLSKNTVQGGGGGRYPQINSAKTNLEVKLGENPLPIDGKK